MKHGFDAADGGAEIVDGVRRGVVLDVAERLTEGADVFAELGWRMRHHWSIECRFCGSVQ